MDDSVPQATTIGIIARPMTVKAAQALGITATAFLAGQTAASTYALLPSIMDSPAPLLARQWCKARRASLRVATVSAAIGTAAFAWMASREPSSRTSSFRLYALASLLLPSAAVYDAAVSRPISAELERRDAHHNASQRPLTASQDSAVASDPGARLTLVDYILTPSQARPNPRALTVHQLADLWGWLNLGQAAFFLTSAFCGAYAVVDEDLSFFELLG